MPSPLRRSAEAEREDEDKEEVRRIFNKVIENTREKDGEWQPFKPYKIYLILHQMDNCHGNEVRGRD